MQLERLAAIAATLALCGCLSVDTTEDTKRAARALAARERQASWAVPSAGRSADVVEFLPGGRVLVGEVRGGSLFGEPSYGPLRLLALDSGRSLWTAERAEAIEVTHALVATAPALVFLTSGDDEGALWALDVDTGRRLWQVDVGGPGRVQLGAGGEQALVLSGADEDGRLTAVRLRDGERLWRAQVPAAGATLTLHGDAAIVSGARLHAFGPGGERRWSAEVSPLGADPLRVAAAAGDLVVWNGAGLAGLGPDGRVRWTRPLGGPVRRLAAAGEPLLCVVGGPDVLAGERVVAVRPGDGQVLWSADAGGVVVGPLSVRGGVVAFPVEDALVGLRVADGAPAFRTDFPPDFALGNPTAPGVSGVPDEVALHDDLLVVDREGQGLRAYRLPSGAEAWSTPPLAGRETVARHYGEVLVAARMTGGAGPVPAGMPLADWGGARRNVLAEQQQARHDQVMHQTGRVLADSGSTAGERRAAIETRRLETQVDLARAERQVAHERALAGAQLGLAAGQAILAIGQQLARLYEQSILTALGARARVNWRWSLRGRGAAFRAGCHVSGFSDREGSGARVVRLGDGRVDELRYEPPDPLQRGTRIPTEGYGLAPDGARLVLIGLGLDADRYQAESDTTLVLRTKGVKASVLCYDLTQARPEPPEHDVYQDLIPNLPVADLQQACLLGMSSAAERMLAAGADPDQRLLLTPPGHEPAAYSTPLRLAAAGHPRLVQLLLAAGAKPTQLEIPGHTAADVASEEMDAAYAHVPRYAARRRVVRELLAAAGAQRRPAAAGSAASPGAPEASDARGAHPYLLRQAMRAGDGWKRAPVVRDALEVGRVDLARLLLERGADPNAQRGGGTALHTAAQTRDADTVRLLLRHGADPDAGRDGLASTPLAVTLNPFGAHDARLEETVRVLLEAGADPNAPLPALVRNTKLVSSLLECAERIGGDLPELLKEHGAR